MDSLVGYGSDEEFDTDHNGGFTSVAQNNTASRRRDDDTNYDDVNMDLSEGSTSESEPEIPPAAPARSSQSSSHSSREDRKGSDDSRERDRERDRDKDRGRRDHRDKRRDSPPRSRHERDRLNRGRSPIENRTRGNNGHDLEDIKSSKRGLLSDKPEDRRAGAKVPSLLDIKPNGEAASGKSQDSRDAVSPRFLESVRRDRNEGKSERDRDRRDRERDRDRHGRRSEEKRGTSSYNRGSSRPRSRSRSRSRGRPPVSGAAYPPPHSLTSDRRGSGDRRGSPPSGEYKPSYKVNKKLEVMEKMGLHIKTPDGSMTTAQQLRAAAGDMPASGPSAPLPSYYNPASVNVTKIMSQVQKRKLLWSNKNKTETEEAAKWSGTRFAQDNDGKQMSKFMRLMGIKEPAALQPENTDKTADPIKKQEELFQAMQAQYEVARATTHTMRGVGLGFQRGQI